MCCTATPSRILRLTLAYRPPLDWRSALSFLAARATPDVEMVADGRYLRTIAIGRHRGSIDVRILPSGGNSIEARVSDSLVPAVPSLLPALRCLFDLDAAPSTIGSQLARDAHLRPLVRRRPGLRVPGAVDGFELAVRAILGQQVSVRGASTLAGRLARRFGEAADADHRGLTRYPVQAKVLAGATVDDVAGVGIPSARARAIRELARVFAGGELRLEPGADVGLATTRLMAIPGIGEWTAQYIALRALHWPDAFPAADAGLRRALGGLSVPAVKELAEGWRPWRGYAAMHLWRSLGRPAGTRSGGLSAPHH